MLHRSDAGQFKTAFEDAQKKNATLFSTTDPAPSADAPASGTEETITEESKAEEPAGAADETTAPAPEPELTPAETVEEKKEEEEEEKTTE